MTAVRRQCPHDPPSGQPASDPPTTPAPTGARNARWCNAHSRVTGVDGRGTWEALGDLAVPAWQNSLPPALTQTHTAAPRRPGASASQVSRLPSSPVTSPRIMIGVGLLRDPWCRERYEGLAGYRCGRDRASDGAHGPQWLSLGRGSRLKRTGGDGKCGQRSSENQSPGGSGRNSCRRPGKPEVEPVESRALSRLRGREWSSVPWV